MATINDKICKANDGSGAYPSIAKVTQGRTTGEKILRCDSLSGWPTDTPVHFVTYRLNADGTINYASQTDWKGLVSGTTITNLEWQAGATDSGNLVDDRVEVNCTVGMWNDLASGMSVAHNADGSLKNNVVKSQNVDWATTKSLTTGGEIKSGAVKASHMDYTTVNFSTERQVGVLGGKPVYEKTIQATPSYSNCDAFIYHGITGIGTPLSATGSVQLTDGSYLMMGAHSYSNGVGVNVWKINTSNIQIIRPSGFDAVQNRPHTVTLRYTKA